MSKHHAIFLHYNALTKEGGPDVCKNDFSFGALNSFLADLMKYCSTMHFTFPKRPITQLKPVQQSRQQELRAYYPNMCLKVNHVKKFRKTELKA